MLIVVSETNLGDFEVDLVGANFDYRWSRLSNPLSLVWPAFVFLCGPFPFIDDPGIAALISSFESPLWWVIYFLVLFQFFKFRKVKFLQDPQILLTLIFLVGEIAFSALVEVNLGTSIRRKSILLVH